MSVLENDKIKTEEKILHAAREVFMEKGMTGARMQDIADKAGINKALLHYYFRSKDKLFDAIFQDTIKRFLPKIDQELWAEQDINKLLKRFVFLYTKLLEDNPFLPIFILNEVNRDPDQLHTQVFSALNLDHIIPIIGKRFLDANIHYDPRQLFLTIISSVIFPYAARPLVQKIMFQNDKSHYDQFINDRSAFLNQLIDSIIPPVEDKKTLTQND